MLLCKCSVGYNGRHCKHQAAVVKKYNILTVSTLCISSKRMLFEIASGKAPNRTMFEPLKINSLHTTQLQPYDIAENLLATKSQSTFEIECK